MDYDKIARSIRAAIEKRPEDKGAYTDLFSLCRSWEEDDFAAAHAGNEELLNRCAGMLRRVNSKETAGFFCTDGRERS